MACLQAKCSCSSVIQYSCPHKRFYQSKSKACSNMQNTLVSDRILFMNYLSPYTFLVCSVFQRKNTYTGSISRLTSIMTHI